MIYRKTRLLWILFATLVGIHFGNSAFASDSSSSTEARIRLHSPIRKEKAGHLESWQEAAGRFLLNLDKPQFARGTALAAAVPLRDLKLSDIPTWKPDTNLQKVFASARDQRFLNDPNPKHIDPETGKQFSRRSTWLYPDDGCSARAALMGQNLAGMNLERPAKVFIFGNLKLQTENSPDHYAAWWYHVANVIQYRGVAYVLDPAVESHKPLTLNDWISRMTQWPDLLNVSICHATTYSADDDCQMGNGEVYATDELASFLDLEWDRLVSLERNPEKELGQFPPWSPEVTFESTFPSPAQEFSLYTPTDRVLPLGLKIKKEKRNR